MPTGNRPAQPKQGIRVGSLGFHRQRSMGVRLIGGVVALLTLSAAVTMAQVATRLGPTDGAGLAPTDLGRVAMGSPAPDFTLESKDGKTVTLSSFRDRKNVVLVFYRGHW